ncbi:MAG: hypothetical protein A2V70_12380 [Planctomycetes bacterium RBG_13_63_9]|nr:MAG: hypothetical protein A2V70_12380 [Planctomycetes bacterium RBG_13_63_9]
MNFERALLMAPGLVIGLTLHEFAHAWSASLLGDGFARRQGRVSLNPLRHLSPLGTLAILVLPFGWGRPVPVNLYNFKHPRRDYLLTSLAGPLANVLVVAACLGMMQLTRHPFRYDDWRSTALVMGHYLLAMTALLNVILATINLIPIPPLDGSKIWPCIVPGVKPAGQARTQLIFVVVLVALLLTGSLNPAINFVVHHAVRWMPVSDAGVFAERASAASTALAKRRWGEAETSYTEALAINHRSHECLYGRAIARYYDEDLQGALEDINRAVALHASPEYLELRALVLRRLGRDKEAAVDEARSQTLRDAAPRTSDAGT